MASKPRKPITREVKSQIHSGSILFGMGLGAALIFFAQEYQKSLAISRAQAARANVARARPIPRLMGSMGTVISASTAPKPITVTCPWQSPLVI